MFARLLCSAALSACLALPVMAESTIRPVVFAAGSTGTAVSGQITGRDTADFTLIAEAGQHMNVRLSTDNTSAYFNIYAPGDVPGESQALFIGSISGAVADLTLPASGTYLIRTYLMASAGRENETARFSLTFDVAGRQRQSGDVTNALNSEPDYWKVTGITGQLNIRSEASTTAAVAGTVANDTVLRSLGCQAVEGRMWCRVETTAASPAVTGWAASDFLTEASAPAGGADQPAPAQPAASAAPTAPAGGSVATSAAATLAGNVVSQPAAPAPVTAAAAPPPAPAAPAGTTAPVDRPTLASARPPAAPPSKIPLGGVARKSVPKASSAVAVSSAKPAPKPAHAATMSGTTGTANGNLPCSTALGMPTRECAFSVTRRGNGNATVRITRPNAGPREIRFESGAPVAISGQTTERRGDLTVINIENERYEIPDAVINGG